MSMRSPACRSAMVSTPVPWRMRNVSFVGAAAQQTLARAAEQQVPAAPADEVILARLSDESVVAAPAEQVIVALAAENQIVAPPAEGKVVSAASENGVVPAEPKKYFAMVGSIERVVATRSELESRFVSHLMAPGLSDGRLASVAALVDNRVTQA